jgi:hypothetical protein
MRSINTTKRKFCSARQILEAMLCALRKNLTQQCGIFAAGVVLRVLNTDSKSSIPVIPSLCCSGSKIILSSIKVWMHSLRLANGEIKTP